MATFSIAVALSSILVALAALWTARGVGRRLRLMNQTLWELRYEHSRLRARLDRLAPEDPENGPADPKPAAPAVGDVSFVPLESVKRRRDA